jgi:hypothetical protein
MWSPRNHANIGPTNIKPLSGLTMGMSYKDLPDLTHFHITPLYLVLCGFTAIKEPYITIKS